ncbi:hypothetical protein [Neobacillus sp. Marseille-QA0830]
MGLRRDSLYIGDGFEDTVARFDAGTGKFHGNFVPAQSGGLHGPRGMIFNHIGNLLVANQNVGLPINGNVLEYMGENGRYRRQFVRSDGENAPFAPRGMVLSRHNILYVADIGTEESGDIRMYKGYTGEFIGTLDHSGFSSEFPFRPRGLVFGPDGLLYVSVFNFEDPNLGWVLRFNPDPATGGFLDVFVTGNDMNNLRRPEGLVFGPDGNLYITSFVRVLEDNTIDPNDTDKILVFKGGTGKFLAQRTMDLYEPGEPRAFAQALLFGPHGKLFVPITGPSDEEGGPAGPDAGSVRRYDVTTKKYTVFVRPGLEGGPLGQPWYLTFGRTDPRTLEYLG